MSTFQQIKTARDLGIIQPGDVLIAERVADQTGAVTYAVKVLDDPAPELAADLTLNGFKIGSMTPTQVGYVATSTGTTGSNKLVFDTGATLSTTTLNTPTLNNATFDTDTRTNLTLNTPTLNNATFDTDTRTNLTLITPALGVPSSGTLTNCTGLPLSTGVIGNLSVSHLNSGTSANSTTFWCGNGTWSSPVGSGTVNSGTLNQIAYYSSAGNAVSGITPTGTGVPVCTTSPTITTPNLIGVTSAVSASAGSRGEVISSRVLSSSAVSILSGTLYNITSIYVTPGNWLLEGNIYISGAASTAITNFGGAINTSSASFPDISMVVRSTGNGTIASTAGSGLVVPPQNILISSPTTYYLLVFAVFTVSTATACGYIQATRNI